MVLGFDTQLLDASQLLLLDLFHLEALVFELLANTFTLFKVVKSLLLLNLCVFLDLLPDDISVGLESILLLILEGTFLHFIFFLTFDNAEEVVAFSLSLFSHHLLALEELSLANNIHLLGLTGNLFFLSNLFLPILTFTLFTSTLGTKSIDFGLSVSSFLLHFSKTSQLSLFLKSETASLFGLGGFSRCLFLIVTENLHVFINDLLAHLSFLAKGNFVRSSHFFHEGLVALAFFLGSNDLSLLLSLNLTHHLLLIFDEELTLVDTLNFTLLNLVNDDFSAVMLGNLLFNLSLFRDFKSLETLDFHHEVHACLLVNVLFLKALVLLQLLVANGNDLGVKHHFVHVLDIVVLLVNLLLCSLKQMLLEVLLSLLSLSGRHFVSPLSVHLEHFFAALFGQRLLSFELGGVGFLCLLLVVLVLDHGRVFDALDFGLGHHGGFTGGLLLGLAANRSQFFGSHNSRIFINTSGVHCFVLFASSFCRKERGLKRIN